MSTKILVSLNEPTSRQSFSPASINEPPAPPELPEGGGPPLPVLSQIQPAMATIGAADVTLQCIGENFTPAAFITFNGGEEPTEWASKTKVTTIVKPSTATTPGSYPVTVVTQFGETEAMMFEFLEAGTEAGTTKAKGWTKDEEDEAVDAADPDALEDEIEQAEEEGDFKSVHASKTTVVVKKTTKTKR